MTPPARIGVCTPASWPSSMISRSRWSDRSWGSRPASWPPGSGVQLGDAGGGGVDLGDRRLGLLHDVVAHGRELAGDALHRVDQRVGPLQQCGAHCGVAGALAASSQADQNSAAGRPARCRWARGWRPRCRRAWSPRSRHDRRCRAHAGPGSRGNSSRMRVMPSTMTPPPRRSVPAKTPGTEVALSGVSSARRRVKPGVLAFATFVPDHVERATVGQEPRQCGVERGEVTHRNPLRPAVQQHGATRAAQTPAGGGPVALVRCRAGTGWLPSISSSSATRRAHAAPDRGCRATRLDLVDQHQERCAVLVEHVVPGRGAAATTSLRSEPRPDREERRQLVEQFCCISS